MRAAICQRIAFGVILILCMLPGMSLRSCSSNFTYSMLHRPHQCFRYAKTHTFLCVFAIVHIKTPENGDGNDSV